MVKITHCENSEIYDFVVVDLFASLLPRVSPQMTAYLIGHHVATQLTSPIHHFS